MMGRIHLRRGFSLVELMVVLAIMLLLVALATPRFLDAQKAAYEASVVSFLRTLQADQESYRLATGSYADNFTDLGLRARAPLPEPSSPQLADLLDELGATPVYAAGLEQQAPQNPPPPPPGGQDFGGQGKKRRIDKQIGGPGGTGAGGPAGPGGGGQNQGGAGGGPPGGPRRGGAGGGAGSQPGGGATGGPTGGAGRGAGGGTGGSTSPLAGPAAKSNLLIKHNYIFRLQRPTATTWTCTAAPVRDRINSKFFYMDQSGVVRASLGRDAGAKSPQM